MSDQRDEDLRKLRALLDSDKLTDREIEPFANMRYQLTLHEHYPGLTDKQRSWVEDVYRRLGLDAEEGAQNLWSGGKVPRGREVEPAVGLRANRPLKPPARKK